MTVEAFAPAKINLTLHVTGQRADGYHLLDSLVVFADLGDVITAEPAEDTSFRVTGPAASGVPKGKKNLVLRAEQLMGSDRGAELTLHKVLPAASGIGGGSSDAAATLRALSEMWGAPVPDADSLMALGADVPVCMNGQTARISGVGEYVMPVSVPNFHMVLVNPNVPLATSQVFDALQQKKNAAMQTELPQWQDASDFCNWLAAQRNDLERPARILVPVISAAISQISATAGCLLARMSGSGATCFGLYGSAATAKAASDAISDAHADWWVVSAGLWQASS
ncbi:MAG: 4-(cytidine 5'-diphospho)-2-C-methyl-D-erythritol kinase [Paracoccaceae bacterium]